MHIGLQHLVARKAKARYDHNLVGLGPHGRGEAAKRARCVGNGLGTAVQILLAGAFHDFGFQHPAIVVDGQHHDQVAIQLAPANFGEVFRAFFLHFVAQCVVVHGVGRFLGGGADVALFRAGVFFVDAFFQLGQLLEQLLALLLLLFTGLLLGGFARIEFGQGGQALAQLREQGGLPLLQGIDLALALFKIIANAGQGRVRHGAGGPALGDIAAASQIGLGNGLGVLWAFLALGIDQDDFQRRIFKHPVELLRGHDTHTQRHGVNSQ